MLFKTWLIPAASERRLLAQVNVIIALGPLALDHVRELALDPDVPDPGRVFAVLMVLGCVEDHDWFLAARDLFIAAAVVIAAAERGVSAKEHKVLQEFVGKHLVLERLDIEQLQSLLPQRIAEVKTNTQIAQRMQVVRDLCLVASAEQPVAKRELELVEKVAEELGVSLDFVRQSLDLPAELD